MSNIENNDSNASLPEEQIVSNPSIQEEQIVSNTINQQILVEEQYDEKTAGFWMRFWAFIVDTLIVGAVVGILVNPIFHLFGWSLSETTWYSPMTIISGLIYYVYFVLTTKFWEQTLGKMIFGLKVKHKNGEKLDWSTVVFREVVGRFISNKILIIYIMVAFMPKNHGLNDLIADTVVVQEKVFIKRKSEREQLITHNEDLDSENPITPVI